MGLLVLTALVFGGCQSDKLIAAACREDSDCEAGLLCDKFECVSEKSKSCEVVVDGNPVLQPSPHVVSFGELDVLEGTQTIGLHNIGNCTLTVFEASLSGGASSPFSCEVCASGGFPMDIFPNRSRPLELSFKAPLVGSFDDELVILSDDREFPELRVPVHARFLGVPDLNVAPNPIDFGFVAQGRASQKQVQVTNRGTGTAPIVVQSIELSPKGTQDFTLSEVPAEAVTLNPIARDSTSLLTVQLQYHPRSIGKHQAELLVTTSKGQVNVPVLGNAETPPKLTYSPSSIDLGQVPLGQSNFLPLTLVNEGGAPLVVSYSWGGPKPSTDLFATPQVVPPIAAGAYLEMQVAVTATGLGPISGMLMLSTNDPSRPSVTIPVTAEGVPGAGPEVVKLEMYFENGSNSAFDNDMRNVDMTLEHPYGYVCNKSDPKPTNWGNYGNPSWIAFAPKEEPERIVLANSTQDGTYRVMLQYMEDCSSLPTALMAGILGISVEVLVGALTSGVGQVNGQDVAKLIENVCLSHSNTNATVKAYVNGTLVLEKTVTLNKKGDSLYAADLIRAGGKFSAK
ncbi:MAG: choice-of-anchor D domain-containing protein [Myxococcales bacterium]|nr:choice-of-anchor D domain-containing protein [Myxococcales bacterium]